MTNCLYFRYYFRFGWLSAAVCFEADHKFRTTLTLNEQLQSGTADVAIINRSGRRVCLVAGFQHCGYHLILPAWV